MSTHETSDVPRPDEAMPDLAHVALLHAVGWLEEHDRDEEADLLVGEGGLWTASSLQALDPGEVAPRAPGPGGWGQPRVQCRTPAP